MKLQAEFKEHGDFALTDGQRARIDTLLAESDSLRLFVRERIERHEYGDITTAEFHQAYAEFCADKGWNVLPIRVVGRTGRPLLIHGAAGGLKSPAARPIVVLEWIGTSRTPSRS